MMIIATNFKLLLTIISKRPNLLIGIDSFFMIEIFKFDICHTDFTAVVCKYKGLSQS